MIIQFLPGCPAPQMTLSHVADVAEHAVPLINKEKFYTLQNFLRSQGIAFTRMNIRNLSLGYGISYPDALNLPSLFRMTRFDGSGPFGRSIDRNVASDGGFRHCIEDLADTTEEEMKAAAFDLTLYGDPRSIPFLFAAIDPKQSCGKDNWYGMAIKEIGDPGTLDMLLSQLKNSSLEVQGRAVVALGCLRDPSAVEPLIRFFRRGTKDLSLRVKVILALGEIKDPRAIPLLIEALRIPRVSDYAVMALDNMDDPRAKEVVRTLHDVSRRRAVRPDLYHSPFEKKR